MESRVFSAVDNPRHLASPDGIGVDFDGNVFLGEGKTSKDDLDPQAGNLPDQYLYQMQWQMHVIGSQPLPVRVGAAQQRLADA